MSFDIKLRDHARIWYHLPATTRLCAKLNWGLLSIRRTWMNCPPDFLQERFEKYRQRYCSESESAGPELNK